MGAILLLWLRKVLVDSCSVTTRRAFRYRQRLIAAVGRESRNRIDRERTNGCEPGGVCHAAIERR
jgi:hypothetical protein